MSGGSTTTSNELPSWYQDAAKSNLTLAQQVAKTGYVPNEGPSVAAFAPQQVDAMQQANDWSSAFGLSPKRDVSSDIPPAQTFAGGIKGYSSYPLEQESMAKLKASYPGLYSYLSKFTIDPVSGAAPAGSQPSVSASDLQSLIDQLKNSMSSGGQPQTFLGTSRGPVSSSGGIGQIGGGGGFGWGGSSY